MKKFKIEYLLYIFIILAPILDMSSYLFKLIFPSLSVTPTAFLRIIIPFILFIYLLVKVPGSRKPLLIGTVIYLLYGLIHLFVIKDLFTNLSYGNLKLEFSYIINYTYMIYLLIIFMYFKKEKKLDYLSKSLVISLGIYLFIIFFSIITNTSASTYTDGTGFRSYFASGNSLCTILLMLVTNLLCEFKNKKIINYCLYILVGIYLIFLVGTRTGMFGFILISICYVVLYIIDKLLKNKKIDKVKLISFLGLCLVLVLLIGFFGSETLIRRSNLNSDANAIIDVNTGEAGHTTGDISSYVYQINNKTLDENLMSSEQQKAYVSTYKFCNKHKVKSTNKRVQELVYQFYLVIYQHNIINILFGNGFYTSAGEMILEMEVFAIILNFGLVGFILYLIPFIYVFIKLVKSVIKNKKRTIDDIIRIIMILMTFGLSCLAGYVFFSGTCVLMLISLMCLVKEDKNDEKNSLWNHFA